MLLTPIKDTNVSILNKLSDTDILKFCSVSKQANNTCNEDFFKYRMWNFYPNVAKYKNRQMTWKNYFLSFLWFKDLSRDLSHSFNYDFTEGEPRIVYNILRKGEKSYEIGLNLAARYGYKKLVDHFINLGAKQFNTPIRTALKYGNHDIARYLQTKLF